MSAQEGLVARLREYGGFGHRRAADVIEQQDARITSLESELAEALAERDRAIDEATLHASVIEGVEAENARLLADNARQASALKDALKDLHQMDENWDAQSLRNWVGNAISRFDAALAGHEQAGAAVGWAAVSDGVVIVPSVSKTRRAAIVNWLCVEAHLLIDNVISDDQIEQIWNRERGSVTVEQVSIRPASPGKGGE